MGITDEQIAVAARAIYAAIDAVSIDHGGEWKDADPSDRELSLQCAQAAIAAVAPLIAEAQAKEIAELRAALAAAWKRTIEEAAKAGEKAWPRAHTYGSENADMYHAQDHAAATVIKAIRAIG